MRIVYRDRAEQNSSEAWHGASVSFSSLHAALQAIETEGAAITVDYIMLMTVEGETLLRQEDVKRLQRIRGRKGSGFE